MTRDVSPHPSLQHPGRWLWLLLLVPVGIGLWRLRFDAEVLDLLPSSIPAVEGLKLYQDHFSNARELILTLAAPTAEQNERAARAISESLRRQTNLIASVVWEPPWQEHPDQMAELVAYLWCNQPPEIFHALAVRLAPDRLASTLAATREELASSLSPQALARLSYDPFGLTQLPEETAGAAPSFEEGQSSFSSPDGTFRIMFVQARPDLRTYADCDRWLRALRPVIEESLESKVPSPKSTVHSPESTDYGPVVLGYTGRPAFVAEAAMGMQHDVKTSVGGTAAIIAALFWLAHRRVKPMLWLLALLALTLGSTLALGGLIYGKINVVSMGFAAILLGLAVDYAVVHYQEALAQPQLSIPQIRHAIAPSIFWAAVTTISAFLVLNFGGLPGLGQLGTLVGLGVALAACIMIFEFLPPLFPQRAQTTGPQTADHGPRTTDRGPQTAGQRTEDRGQRTEGRGRGLDTGHLTREPETTDHGRQSAGPQDHETTRPQDQGTGQTGQTHTFSALPVFSATAALILVSFATLLFFGGPGFDSTANALRPRDSKAYDALAQIQNRFNRGREPIEVLIAGRTEIETGRRLADVQSVLAAARSNHIVSNFALPTPLWPQPQFQTENRASARGLAFERTAFRQAALTNGFSERALGLTDKMLDTWQVAADSSGVFWPTNPMSRWLFDKFSARTGTNYFVVGQVTVRANTKDQTPNTKETPSSKVQNSTSETANVSPTQGDTGRGAQDQTSRFDTRYSTPEEQRTSDSTTEGPVAMLERMLPQTDVWLSSWSLLGSAIFGQVKANFWKLLAPMIFLVLLSLWLAFKRLPEIALSLAVLLLSGICLLTVMQWAHWSWNLLNLMAIPLILGTGVDYSIFMQLALRRFSGDRRMAYRAVGRALLLCGGTAIAGFGSLALSSNAGMASLGEVCATGIGANMLVSVLLLPGWWTLANTKHQTPNTKETPNSELQTSGKHQTPSATRHPPSTVHHPPSTIHHPSPTIHHPSPTIRRVSVPSRFYGASLWRLGMGLVRVLPPWLLKGLCKGMAALHFRVDRQRREVVVRNLLPALSDNRAQAHVTARRLYRNFAMKLADLWRVESGLVMQVPLTAKGDLAVLQSALHRGCGVLLMTAHVGNWELGALLLEQLGVKLTVLTLAEPDERLTELRLASRANRGTETIVIGPDGFAFVEVIKRLQEGKAVAILVDRPRPGNSFSNSKAQFPTAEVNPLNLTLFGHPFAASFAAVELARASGCALLAVTIAAEASGYVARVLPEFAYQQQALIKPEARRQLMQQILTSLESEIRAHLDQWYQFVPVFRAPGQPGN